MYRTFETEFYPEENFMENDRLENESIPDSWDDESIGDDEEFKEPVCIELPAVKFVAPKPTNLPSRKASSTPSDVSVVSETVSLPLSWCSRPSSTISSCVDVNEFPSLGSDRKTPRQKMPRLFKPIQFSEFEKKYKKETSEGWKTKKQQFRERKTPAPVSFEKTKMCFSVERGTRCPHGKNCRFAHTTEELVLPQCHFGARCNFIVKKGGVVCNKDARICRRIHAGETRTAYFKRVGMAC